MWIGGILLVLLVGFHIGTTRQQRIGMDQLIDRWRHDYHLTDDQARRVRAMEESFHGSGDPFTRPAHTAAETREHHRGMAAIMNPEDGERFFKAQEGLTLSR